MWKLFLALTDNYYEEEDWPDETIQCPTDLQLNGRQIQNANRTVNTLALAEKKQHPRCAGDRFGV